MIKNKKTALLTSLIILFFEIANFASAKELSPCSSASNLKACIGIVFKYGVSISGGIAAASFVVGAAIFMMSGDNPEAASSGKDRMRGAILGLVLLGGSWIIMNTINSDIINSTMTPLAKQTVPDVPVMPGVYFYSDSGCSQADSGSTTGSMDSIGADVRGVKIINGTASATSPAISYGIIIHQESGLKNGGSCTTPITDSGCQQVEGGEAIDVWQVAQNPSLSGNGVLFYSEPFGPDRGSKAGFYTEKAGAIQSKGTEETPSQMKFEYTNINVTDEYKNKYVYFGDRPGSVAIKGDYLVAFYSGGAGGGDSSYCQTFTDDATNLNSEPIVASGTGSIDKIYIIPKGFTITQGWDTTGGGTPVTSGGSTLR